MKNNQIIHVMNAEIINGFMGNTGKVAGMLFTGVQVSDVVVECYNRYGLEEKQVKIALSNLKNRSKCITYITDEEFIELVKKEQKTQPKKAVKPTPKKEEVKVIKPETGLTPGCYILYVKEYREGSTSSKIIKHVKEGMSKGEIITACLEDKESGLTEKQVKAYLSNAVAKVKNITFK